MFIKLTHGLHAVLNAIVSYIQKWTDDSVPDGTRTLHNFKDGQGKRPAVPLDELTNGNNIVNVKTDSKFEYGVDETTSSENVLKVELKTELAYGSDNIASKTGIEDTVCVPEPIIFEISNEVPDKIEKVIPVKTQALPGQDFIFQILYVKDYNYIEGDILPVFGTWGNYARLSKDGKYLTVNSNADLSVRLILTPAPQDWIPEQPDPSIIQQAGDRMLNTIPRDGAKADYTIEEMKIEDNFYNVTVENQATTFVTNGEFSNGKYYNVGATTNKITIPMTFAEGFDENAVYWKCYDDPKCENPAIGYYPIKDYNEEFGPLPSGFRKLQYIYPNNNAYIDLGVKLKKDYKVKILMNVTERTDNSYIGLFGARNSTDTDFYNDNHTNGAYACYVKYNYRTIGLQRGSHRYFNYNHDYPEGKICWYYSDGINYEVRNYDDTLIRKISAAASENIDTEWNCYLFTVNDKGTPYSYGTYGNLYRFEMWDENDNLLMRLIPAKNLDTNSCGLYDIINNKFYYNKRPMGYFSGPEFYVWQKQMQTSDHNNVITLQDTCANDLLKVKIPSEYKKLYGVYFRECYLNTNYKVKKDDTIITCVTINNSLNSNSYKCVFGSRSASPSNDIFAFYSRFNGQNVPNYGRNNVWNYGTNIVYDKPIKIVLEPNKASLYSTNDESSKFDEITAAGTGTDSSNNLWLGCCNYNGSIYDWGYVTFHYFKIYDKDGNLVLDYVPARRVSDSAIGFYNTVNNTFVGRTGGNYSFEERAGGDCLHYNLIIENITKDINLGIIRNPAYDNPFKLEDCIEDEHQNEPKDSLIYTYEITDSKILDYFYVVDHVNNATDYATLDSTYKTANVGNPVSFTVSYKSGYDNYDIKCIANTDARITIGKTHYITYNELDIPAEYTPVKGLKNSDQGYVYIKTGYIPKWNDKVVCYASLQSNYYTYPSYLFGCTNGNSKKSFVFGRKNYDGMMYYDRSSGFTDIQNLTNDALMKITADNNGCECDYAYNKKKIDTEMYKIIPAHDYNSDVNLPDAYTKISYLQNTYQSHINTNLSLKQTYKVELITNIIAENTNSTWNALFGSEQGSENSCYSIYTRSNGNRRFCFSFGDKDNIGTENYDLGKDYIIRLSNEALKLYDKNETLLQTIIPTGTPRDNNYNAFLFTLNRSNSSYYYRPNARIYSYKVYNENDELICRMIPARRNSDGVVGMYDVVRNTFHTNSGSDSFSWNYINESEYEDCDYEMYLFNLNQANNRQYSCYGSIYKFMVYDGDGNQKINLVPVRRISDSVLGFYDTIRQIFIAPENGTLTEATEPIYKGNIVVSDIPNDTTITITKNNDSRKTIVLEEGIEDDVFHQQIDQIEYNYELKNIKLEDWFYTVKYINNAQSICSLKGDVATYYNVPRIGSSTRFPVTYNVGTDNNMIEATATAGATVEITKPIEIIYNHFPDEYIEIYGIRNSGYNIDIYFEIPYKIKANDTIKLYVSDEKSSYTYYIFGSGINETRGCVLCSRYENYSNNMFYSRNKRVNITGPQNEVLEIVCKPHGIDYTNGYDDYSYTLDNIPDDSDTLDVFHLFGACLNSYYRNHAASFCGTIYKCTISDENGVTVNLVPVKRKVDGAIGFYDTVGDTFYLPNNDNGSLSIASAPKLKGRIIVSNITDDTDVIVTQKTQPTLSIDLNNSIDYSYNIESCSLIDYWHYIAINNTTDGELTFTNTVYGGNCYTCLHDNSITMPCSYKSGRASTDFIVSEGTLTNNGLVLNNVKDDKNITVMLNDYHDPKSDTDDDLNIFTNPDFSNFNQYRVVNGTDLMLTSYSFINSQVAAMNNKQIFEFNVNEIDILSFDPNNIPGEKIKAKIVTSDSNMNEVVQNVTIDDKLMYKHTVTLKNQIKLENGKTYMFKVRDNTDTGKLIAYAKDTGPFNLVNSNGEYIIEDDNLYFKWDEPNKYIVKGNKTIYFELNGIKL